MKRADNDHGRASVPQRRRRPALKTEYHSEREMRSRIIGFPASEEIWSQSKHPILINPEQPIRIYSADRCGSLGPIHVGLCIHRHDDKIVVPAGIDTLEAVLQIRRFRFRNIMFKSDLIHNMPLAQLLGYNIHRMTKHGQSLCRQAILNYTGYGLQEFKLVSALHFDCAFGDEVKAMAASHRGMRKAIPSARLRGFLEREQAIITMIERAVQDADHVWSSIAAVFQSNIQGHTPTLNSVYRIFSADCAPATESDVLAALVAISFFGCTNAVGIYFEHKALSEVCHLACFLGRVNLGLLQPTWLEAGAYLHLICDRVDHEGLLPESSQKRKMLSLLRELLDLTPYRDVLELICEHTFDRTSPDQKLFEGHLWPML